MSAETIVLPEPVRQARLKLLEETRNFYYGPDFEPLSTRAYEYGSCVYLTLDDRRCAIGRMWPEFAEIGCGSVSAYDKWALPLAKRDGLHCGDDEATMVWLCELQRLHDHSSRAADTYQAMLSELQEPQP